MLSLSLVVIRRLRWEGMSHKLRVEIARMIGLFERKPEIVHGEHIFEELRLLEVPYPTRLTSRIKQVSQRIRADVENVMSSRCCSADSSAELSHPDVVPARASPAPQMETSDDDPAPAA